MAKEPLLEIKIEPFILNDKCAEVYRNNNLGTYSFLCNTCDETLDSSGVDSIFKHLDSHYYIEGHDDDFLQENLQEMTLVEELINQTEFLDVNQPIIENNTSTTIEILDRFNCDICENTFTSESDLIEHLREHTPRNTGNIIVQNNINSDNENEGDPAADADTYICDQCDKKYPSIPSLRRHYKTVHPELYSTDQQDCDQCDEKYSFKEELNNHRREKHPVTIKADQCGNKVMKNSNSFKIHYTDLLLSRFKCKECDKVLKNTRSLNAHYNAHAKSRFKCNECDRQFKNETLLKDHICAGLKEITMLECSQCDKKYLSKLGLTIHGQKKHNIPVPRYECNVCNETFNNIRSFAVHRRSNHPSTFQFKCNVCDKVFKNISHFTSHKNIHDPTTLKHVCDICAKKFRELRNLRIHIRTHTGERPYECTICQKKLITSGELKAHIMRAHTFEKKFQCDQCGKHFYSRSTLKVHMRFHTNDRPYKCQFCDEKFHTTGTRNDHQKKHSGERPYKCKVCEYACRTSKGLRQHSILHTGAKPYSCRFCDMKFAQSAGRRGHERNRHGC